MFFNGAIYRIRDEDVERCRHRIAQHAETCLRVEPNCIRFDVGQSREDRNLFVMYEVFRDASDFDAHARQPHTIAFVADRDAEGWLDQRTLHQLDPVFLTGGEQQS